METTAPLNVYLGEYRSAIARAKKLLIAAGLPWSTTTGRYTPFFNRQHTTYGLRITRVGVSDSIALHVWGDNASISDEAKAKRKALQARALEVLRAGGLPFDDRGWLDCGRKARKALAKPKPAPKTVPRIGPTITITFPDTAEVRNVLGDFTAHLSDDEEPFFEDARDQAKAEGDPEQAARDARALAACIQVREAIERTIYPDPDAPKPPGLDPSDLEPAP